MEARKQFPSDNTWRMAPPMPRLTLRKDPIHVLPAVTDFDLVIRLHISSTDNFFGLIKGLGAGRRRLGIIGDPLLHVNTVVKCHRDYCLRCGYRHDPTPFLGEHVN